jgi:glycosyltransferase involved in cell wall biosynthesis
MTRSTAAIYDEWWSTAGGGEKFAAGIGEVLSADHDVVLLSHAPLDLDALGERLHLDLSRVGVRQIERGPGAVEDASADVDLFVNASYTSTVRNRAQAGLYVVHFPSPPPGDGHGWKALAKRTLRPAIADGSASVAFPRGFYAEEMIWRRRVRWTDGDATAEVLLEPGEHQPVTIGFLRFGGAAGATVVATVEVDGRRAATVPLRVRRSRRELPVTKVTVDVTGHDDGSPVRIRITSDAVVARDAFGSNDDRRLGVPVTGMQVGAGPRAFVRDRYPSLGAAPGDTSWTASYDRVVSNSEYTRQWVRRWWGIDTGVLNPPVTPQPRGTKDQVILNVGRFFAPEHGHCKKQLDLVRAMRALQWRGRIDGWTLHLVGGVSEVDRPYLERVRREAEGLPVEIHVDASGAEVRDLYARASLYWHATGLGEDPDTQPDRFEHFGITTAEAMSAGAVPLVIRAAGQREVVEHGVSGLTWEPLVQLVCFTEDLVLDPERLATMSKASEARAERYSMPAFADHLRGIVAEIAAGEDTSDVGDPSDPTSLDSSNTDVRS